ncbi:PIN domain-containing protein [Candidatus Woesearchaeota archaeon]|nr:PIN domain-containing protein [Candidatus Woesearchaeota archaeon]
MKKRYILDTLIWRDFYEDRVNLDGKSLGKPASEVIKKIFRSHATILFSEGLIWELRKRYTDSEISELLNIFFQSGILVRVQITREEHSEAERLASSRKIPLVDCLNAIHARNHNAIVVTRDPHLLNAHSDIAKSVRPKNV